ncbi:response regulator [Paenibacillus sp. V4I7]|uniref:response regulator transcription factor n=1 Tax=Paenibacillus sp. V4I7 TaxID=3042307 RepID=UPI002786B640|nr:response regulator [Paenibacillus sp. V4I7]MDQ0897723.1 two-component system response regulator YesN [Paenibacillus sp. V4I7]
MTYQMLLVDDEIHAIEGVKSDLDLNKLGITGLFTAYNIRQAKEILDKEIIDILLCDIEMPQGSGLELLSWVREHHPDTATIFLTSHADFKYAKEALQLGSLDYLLKPVLAGDLENAIRRAQGVIDRNSEISRNSKSHQLWLKHHSLIIERFWLDIINHSTPSHPAAIREQVERHHIPVSEDSRFLPILISVQRWKKTLKRRDEKILEYALKNSAEELIIDSHGTGICFHLERGMLLVILVASCGTDWKYAQATEACNQFIDSCNRYFYCDLSCYFGEPAEAHEIADMLTKLRTRDRNNVAFVNQIYPYHDTGHTDQPIKLPTLSSVSSLLKSGTKESVIQEVEKFLGDLVRNQEMDAEVLHQFYQDFMQALYSFLNLRGVQAHQLFGDDESRRVSETAGRSVTDMLAWVHHAVNKAMIQAEAVKETDTVVQTIRRYIALNIDQDLSREMIADQVFMNPDYLSRIFKKETGYSISDYVLLERIKLAKELLSQTNISISAIASSAGYTNFSHFTKIFKKYAGIGPTEYRSQFGHGTNVH